MIRNRYHGHAEHDVEHAHDAERKRRRMTAIKPTEKPSWWQRLSGGLKRTSSSIGSAIADLVTKRKLDPRCSTRSRTC